MRRDGFNGSTALAFAVFTILAIIGMIGTALMAGCAHDPASKARQVVMTVDTGAQVATIGQLACTQVARTQTDQNKIDDANKTYGACENLNASIHVATDATDATLKAIKAAETAGKKDFSAELAPIYSAACDLQDAVKRASTLIGKPIPIALPCPEVK